MPNQLARACEELRLAGQKAQLAPIESKRADGRGHRQEGGINAAVRELGIDRTEAKSDLAEQVRRMAQDARRLD